MPFPGTGKPGRHGGWAFLLLLSVPPAASAAEPAVRFATLRPGRPLVVEVSGLPAGDLEQLRRAEKLDWPALLSVRVAGGRSDLLGSYRVENGKILFESRYPPAAGLTFRATLDPRKIPGRADGHLVFSEATLSKPAASATTTVAAVYPSGDRLPENQLRFYIHFTSPMSRQDAYAHVKLLNDMGDEVKSPFLELGEELWDQQTRRFTLLLHPGRIKRGLKPREELGPILEEGKRYTLVIAADWPDAQGNPLKSAFHKKFGVGPPEEAQPDPKEWSLRGPAAGGRDPLAVRSPRPLDHALFGRLLWVVDGDGRRVSGSAALSEGETHWSFTPAAAWKPGRYRLVIDTALEDRAGNSIARPFELDLVQPRPQEKPRLVERDFTIK